MRSFEATEPHMGTLVRIKLYADDPESAKSAFRVAFDRIAELDDELSDYKPESELSRLGQSAVNRPVKVSEDLFRVLEFAQTTSWQTNGAFDVTLGPLTHLWRESRKAGHAPDTADVQASMKRCGFRKMHLDPGNRTVALGEAGMQLDVGGLAKGYAADEALTALKKLGIGSALVAASGDLAFHDPPPGQPGWKIGIDSLDDAGEPFTRVVTLANAAVSTSGDTEQHLDDHGKRYSHIIDPRTGLGLTNSMAVTVIAPLGIEADANATAVSVLGTKAGLALVESQPRLAALIVERTTGQPRLVESATFRRIGDVK
jgi:thiamine biosynthesis lipoprotein